MSIRSISVIRKKSENKEAHAKSHRKKIENIFFTNKNNVIGISDENTLIIRVDSEKDCSVIKEKIDDIKNNAYGISGIDNIIKYRPNVYKTKGISNYKVKLFNFNEFSTNKSHKAKFEMLLTNEEIKFVKTNIFKIAGMQTKGACYLCAKMRRGALYEAAENLRM